MFKNREKYRRIIYLLSFFYVSFFFLTPYFHHHHSESGTSQEKSEIIHSHLFNDFNDIPYSEESYSHYEDENHHSHLFQNIYVFSIAPSRDLQPPLNINFYSTLDYSIADKEISAINTTTIDCFSKLQWSKFVHSATNISPPLT
ncbi:MAG: hypothetical protein IIA48_05600 [Bacteroidetes bacterium]|nr:hypothetical protein [Bacteroidota bacterium]